MVQHMRKWLFQFPLTSWARRELSEEEYQQGIAQLRIEIPAIRAYLGSFPLSQDLKPILPHPHAL